MANRKPKILLSEGSSLSAREAITALGLAGHRVELVSSDPMCVSGGSRALSANFIMRRHVAMIRTATWLRCCTSCGHAASMC